MWNSFKRTIEAASRVNQSIKSIFPKLQINKTNILWASIETSLLFSIFICRSGKTRKHHHWLISTFSFWSHCDPGLFDAALKIIELFHGRMGGRGWQHISNRNHKLNLLLVFVALLCPGKPHCAWFPRRDWVFAVSLWSSCLPTSHGRRNPEYLHVDRQSKESTQSTRVWFGQGLRRWLYTLMS